VWLYRLSFPRKTSIRYGKFKKLAVFIDSHYVNYIGLLHTS